MLNKDALALLGTPFEKNMGPLTSVPAVEGGLAGLGRGMPGDAYRGASRFDRDLVMWSPINQSADNEILLNKATADARTKDAVRNDSYIQNGTNIQKDSVVGSMYMLNAKPNRAALGLSAASYDEWETEFQEEVESLWTLSAESPDCWLDAARSMPFTGQVRLAVGIFATVGEFLATAEYNKTDKTRPFKTNVHFVDVDRLMTPIGAIEGSNLRRGVFMDDFGAPTAFSICDRYPNDFINSMTSPVLNFKIVPTRTPWGREQVLYLKDPWRAGQTRGISTMVAALKEWKMTKGFRDITLQNAITNATYAASIESEFPDEAFAALGGSGPNADVGTAIENYAGAYLGAIDAYTGNRASSLMLDGVRIPHLFPGTKLQLRPAGTPGGIGTGFEDSLLRYLSAALGVSYEQLSKNYSNTNYSSIRAAMIETWKYMQARKRLIADRFATSVYRLWFEEMYNAGAFTTLPKSMPSIYIGMNLNAYTACDWIGAGRGQIDELKETQGAMLRLSNNISTLESECGKLGLDWRQVLRQRGREEKFAAKVGIVTAMASQQAAADQNTKNAASGAPHTPEDNSNGNAQGS